MEIKAGRMISLGYGKFWRSDAIVGLMPIEEERGPRQRTEVYTATLDGPIVASRSERRILEDMAFAGDEIFRMEEAREIMFSRACKTIAPKSITSTICCVRRWTPQRKKPPPTSSFAN